MKKIIIPLITAAALYTAATIPNSIKVNQKLKPLKQEFTETAQQSDYQTITHDNIDTQKSLDYNGKLEEIINKRNEILDQEDSILLGRWLAVKHGGGSEIDTYFNTITICYNPLKKIE